MLASSQEHVGVGLQFTSIDASLPASGFRRSEMTSGDGFGRREFIGGAAAVGGVMFIPAARVWGSAANSAVRVGLLGCGGRGTEDATNLVETGGARIVALAVRFKDQWEVARAALDKMKAAKG